MNTIVKNLNKIFYKINGKKIEDDEYINWLRFANAGMLLDIGDEFPKCISPLRGARVESYFACSLS